ncbi:glycosyltransferase family 2 protein [Psychrobacter sp. Marseille-P5312]|uniref:glycosyltransferase family 2 protein n=1 Tax=Psychrobacter sp. Marseille-P5312 TaxID=2086574 RepID=UPI000CF64F10|nr:glycosyltransferase family 2 protein [Psychrobacter sp. Marseille-P5312]
MKLLSWLNHKISPQIKKSTVNLVRNELQTNSATVYHLTFSDFKKRLLYGFYFLEVENKSDHTLGYYQVHILLESGDKLSYALPLTKKGVSKRLIWVPSDVKDILLSSATRFNSVDLSIEINKASKSFARQKIKQKLINKLDYDIASLKHMHFEELWELYNICFPTHENQCNYRQWVKFKEHKLWSPLSSNPLSFQIILKAYDTAQLESCEKIIEQLENFGLNNKILLLTAVAFDQQRIMSKYTAGTFNIITTDSDKAVDSLNEFLTANKPPHCLFLDSSVYSTLSPYMFSELTHAIHKHSNCEIIYFDEDHILEQQRLHPIFKQSLNIDLLYSQNYIGDNCYLSYESLSKYGGFNSTFGDSFLYGHYLITSQESPQNIFHIPKVLLHKTLTDETHVLLEQKPSINEHSEMILNHHQPLALGKPSDLPCAEQFLNRINPDIQVDFGILPNTHRITWPLPKILPRVTIIIPTKDSIDLVKTAVDSIFANTTYTNYEIIIVNNNSEKASSLEYFERLVSQHTNVTCLDYPYPFNYSAINNFAAKHTSAPVLVFLNNDVKVISANWLTELVRQALREDIGCVGAKLYYENGLIQHAGVIMGLGHVAGHSHRFFDQDSDGYLGRLKQVQNYLAVTGACLAIRRSVFEEIDGFEEEKLPVAYNDVDLCLKSFKKGYRNVWTPYAELYHYESLSRGKDTTPEKKARFLKEVEYMHHKWDTYIKSDPYHNPNFAANKENFTV